VTAVALALVVFSAFIHASWNFVLKKSGGGTGLVTCASLTSLLIYAPIVLGATWYVGYDFKPMHLALMFASGMIHTFYFLLLDRAYRSGGDLSIVYPLARSTGPLITIVVAVMLLGERPRPHGDRRCHIDRRLGAAAHRQPVRVAQERGAPRRGLRPPHGLRDRELHDLRQGECGLVAHPAAPLRLGMQFLPGLRAGAVHESPRPRQHGGRVARTPRRVIAIALGSPLSYILVLTAMVFTPVSLVAPAREVSILFAALMGAHFLREGDLARRVVAAIGMVLGISGLALG
jgi:uncharacterized membrane protein